MQGMEPMYTRPLFTAMFCMIAASSSGQTVSPGDAQLAALAKVPPGIYSTAQLIQLLDARRENDTNQERYILSQTTTTVVTRSDTSDFVNTASPSVLGLTLAEEIALSEAIRENDRAAARFITSGAIRTSVPHEASVVTPGEAQLAALVGVDPAEYTLAELIAMQTSTTDF